MRSIPLLISAVLVLALTYGCQTITSDKVVFEPARLDLPLDRLPGVWTDSDGEEFRVRRVEATEFVVEADGEEPVSITLLAAGGVRIDRPPADGKPLPPVYVNYEKIGDDYIIVTSEGEELRGRDLSYLMHVRLLFDEKTVEAEVEPLYGQALYQRLEKQPKILAHEKSREGGNNPLADHVTIRLKDDPAKIRRFILDHLNDADLFPRGDDGPVKFKRSGDLPSTRPATHGVPATNR